MPSGERFPSPLLWQGRHIAEPKSRDKGSCETGQAMHKIILASSPAKRSRQQPRQLDLAPRTPRPLSNIPAPASPQSKRARVRGRSNKRCKVRGRPRQSFVGGPSLESSDRVTEKSRVSSWADLVQANNVDARRTRRHLRANAESDKPWSHASSKTGSSHHRLRHTPLHRFARAPPSYERW